MNIYPIVSKSDVKFSKPKSVSKTRFDKTSTIKFPVSEAENAYFRYFWKVYKEQISAGSITVFLTMLFRFGLRHQEVINHSIDYKDTKIYKTLKPNQLEKEMISGVYGLTIEWQLSSDRKTVHRIMLSVLQYLIDGGSLNYEEIQQFRPF